MNERTKVLYIAGSGRSGSTLVHNILGQLDGVCAVGELRYIWERSFRDNRLCGCGLPFADCPHWNAVVNEAFGDSSRVDVAMMHRQTESFRVHHFPQLLVPGRREALAKAMQPYLDVLATLYGAIRTTTGRRWILDSSKNPAYAYLLSLVPEIELHVLHLIRDPRAVAYSWQKRKAFEPDPTRTDYMAQYGPLKSAFQWISRNSAVELFLPRGAQHSVRLRYEDFSANPRETLMPVAALLGEDAEDLPFLTDRVVQLRPSHSVFGNLVRFRTGPVEITPDEQWISHMDRASYLAVTATTWPLFLRYGYGYPTQKTAGAHSTKAIATAEQEALMPEAGILPEKG